MEAIQTEVLVIGGGATGLGVVRDAALRGYDTVLCGGGDGTFTRCVTDVAALRPARQGRDSRPAQSAR